MKVQTHEAVDPLANLDALSTRIKSLAEVCPFDVKDFYENNKGLVKKYLRKNTLELEIPDFQDVPEDWLYKNQEGILRHGIKGRTYTTLQMLDWIKCGLDVAYLAKKHIKIISIDDGLIPFRLYDFQEDLLHLYQNNRFIISMQARQTGKCVVGDTEVRTKFLGTEAKASIGSVFKLSTTINKFRLSNRDLNSNTDESIYETLLQIDHEEKTSYSKIWRETPYNAKKYWWGGLRMESRNVNSEGALRCSSSIDEDVRKREQGKIEYAPCSSYDEQYKRRNSNFGETVRESEEREIGIIEDLNEWRTESVLWENPRRQSSQRNERKNSFGRIERSACLEDERMVGRESLRVSKYEARIGNLPKNIKFSNWENEIGGREKENLGVSKEVLSREYAPSDWNSSFGRAQKKDRRETQREEGFSGDQRTTVKIKAFETEGEMSALRCDRPSGRGNDKIPLRQLQEKKFRESYSTSGLIQVFSDSGWVDVNEVHQTVKYDIWKLETENFSIKCADNHIVFDENYNEKFVKDLRVGDKVHTEDSLEIVRSVYGTTEKEFMYDLGVDHMDHRYYTGGILSHNTQTTAAYILWFVMFHSAKTSAILANKADQAQEILARIQLSYESLPYYLQPGVRVYNKRKIELDNHSVAFSAASGSSSIRGKSIALLYIDEAAFIPNDMEFYESTYPTVASGKNSQVIITSTPNGTRGLFYKLWQESISQKNEYVRQLVTWDMVPGRDLAWKQQTISNTSPEQFGQEHSCIFRGSQNSLLSADVMQNLVSISPVDEIEGVKIYKEPVEGHTYTATCDVSRGTGGDFHAMSIVDISTNPFEVVATYRNNRLSPLLYPNLIYNIASYYNEAHVLVELNDNGQEVGNILYYDLEYENVLMTVQDKSRQVVGFGQQSRPGVRTTTATKAIGISNIKTMIEKDKIILNDMQTIDEFGTFVPKGKSYEADNGAHDDMVMTLVIFGWLTTQTFFVEMTDKDFRNQLLKDQEDMAMSSIAPFGIIDNGIEEYTGDIDKEARPFGTF